MSPPDILEVDLPTILVIVVLLVIDYLKNRKANSEQPSMRRH